MERQFWLKDLATIIENIEGYRPDSVLPQLEKLLPPKSRFVRAVRRKSPGREVYCDSSVRIVFYAYYDGSAENAQVQGIHEIPENLPLKNLIASRIAAENGIKFSPEKGVFYSSDQLTNKLGTIAQYMIGVKKAEIQIQKFAENAVDYFYQAIKDSTTQENRLSRN